MMDAMNQLLDAPLPTIFIIAGIFFLVLSVSNKLGAKIDINPKRQGQAILIGIVLIVVGIIFYLEIPDNVKNKTTFKKDGQKQETILWNDSQISIYSMRNDKTYLIPDNANKIHISCGGFFSLEAVEKGKNKVRFKVLLENKPLKTTGVINYKKDTVNNEWHLQQFYKLSGIEKNKNYKIHGITLGANNDTIDQRIFYIRKE